MFYQNADPESLILVDIILNIKVAYLNGLYSGQYLRQAKVNALPACVFQGSYSLLRAKSCAFGGP
jgi:hypothetical protein